MVSSIGLVPNATALIHEAVEAAHIYKKRETCAPSSSC